MRRGKVEMMFDILRVLQSKPASLSFIMEQANINSQTVHPLLEHMSNRKLVETRPPTRAETYNHTPNAIYLLTPRGTNAIRFLKDIIIPEADVQPFSYQPNRCEHVDPKTGERCNKILSVTMHYRRKKELPMLCRRHSMMRYCQPASQKR